MRTSGNGEVIRTTMYSGRIAPIGQEVCADVHHRRRLHALCQPIWRHYRSQVGILDIVIPTHRGHRGHFDMSFQMLTTIDLVRREINTNICIT